MAVLTVERHIRGMQPWPGPFSELHQPGRPAQRLQILAARVVPIEPTTSGHPGDVHAVDPAQITIRCGEHAVQIIQLKPDGKRPMSTADFLHGRKLSPGDRFE